MSGCHNPYTVGKIEWGYYGPLDGPKPIRSWGEDVVREREREMLAEMKDMEDRIKRHITECKREVIRELLGIRTRKEQIKKEKDDGTAK